MGIKKMKNKQVSRRVVWVKRLFMRGRHGGHRVKITSYTNATKKYEAIIDRTKRLFESFRQLFLFVTQREPTMSCDRYFRIGKYEWDLISQIPETTLDIFKSPPEGIDLNLKYVDIKRIAYGRFKPMIRSISKLGMPEEDILQEVFKGVLVRNLGKCPWDSDKGSFGSYVHMVIQGILYNLHAREMRRYKRERLGLSEHVEQTLADKRVRADSGIEDSILDLQVWISKRPDSHKVDAKLAGEIIPLVFLGLRRGEIAKQLDLPGPKVTRALSYLRANSPVWIRDLRT